MRFTNYRPKIQLMLVLILVSSWLNLQCGSNSENQDVVRIPLENLDVDSAETDTPAKNNIYSIPSPSEVALLIKHAGANYDNDLLNTVENSNRYLTTKSRATNLGVYLVDVSYATLFGQTQNSIKYMNTARKLAEQLGIPEAINEDLIKRIEINQNDKNAILSIISESYMKSNTYLSPEVSTMVVVGGWIEGMFLASQLCDRKSLKNNNLANRIIDQRLSLGTVLNLLDKHKRNADVASILMEMNDLKAIFDKIEVVTSPIETEKNELTNSTNLKSKTEVLLSIDIFNTLCNRIEEIRKNWVK